VEKKENIRYHVTYITAHAYIYLYAVNTTDLITLKSIIFYYVIT